MDQHDELRRFLRDVRRRWFAQVALRTLGYAAAAAALAGLAGLALERAFQPAGLPLVLLSAATCGVAAAAAGAIVWRMQRRPDDVHVARFVEERAAELPGLAPLEDALVTAVDAGTADAMLRPLLLSEAVRRLPELVPSQIVPWSRIRRSAIAAAAALALFFTTIALGRDAMARSLETARVTLDPDAIHVDVAPGDARLVAGQPLQIRATVRSGARTLSRYVPSLVVSADGQQRSVAMLPRDTGFVFQFESVDRTFKYSVSAASIVSKEYTVTALFAPRVERIDLRYEYPRFSGLKPREERDGGDIYGPAGTRVQVRVHTDKPIAGGVMSLAAAGTKSLRRSGERTLEADLVLSRDDSYRLRLTDADGLAAAGESEYFIRLMDDRPPDVRISRPGGDQQITPLEEVAIEAQAEDDYGIAAFELVYAVPGGQTRSVPFEKISGTASSKVGVHLLAAENLNVEPGDVIAYFARARDVGRGKRSTETRSDMFFLEVRPFNEEFVEAQSQVAAGPAAAQIEALIAAQKEIISATWNIERRSAAGRSAADVQSVADAQAELKARAEQMVSGRGRRRGAPPLLQQILPGSPSTSGRQAASDPVRAAVQAMQRALDELQGQRTKDALPHEMEALQALIRAQAEVRRREVMRQQANAGSGGSGRQGQDLSALFDKELQRQQQTNYETRSRLEERPDQADQNSALDRIRDLARRQEDLSRQQRELADSNLGPEERKRQLERLTREQTTLREQLEELARQLGRQSAEASDRAASQEQDQSRASASRGRQSGRPSSGGAVRDATEQMRSATGDLQRNDPTAAAERSARAAERLRQMEQQMRGGSADARHRAAGELQLEARQIADEQRRIAAEADRLQKGEAAANADAIRRLAGDKERLAERVDALRRGAADLAKGEQDARHDARGHAVGARAASQELERQEIGRRMRDGAKQMREGAGAPRGDVEQEIARSMDRVADLLGGNTADARQLSGQLEQTREIRERLDRLERQIAEAEREQTGEDRSRAQAGREGRSGAGRGTDHKDLARLREEYGRELQRAKELLAQLQQSAPSTGLDGRTPEHYERSQSDPGNQPFKQDFSGWASLKKDVNLALERTEAAASARLARQAAQDRLSAGGSERVPDAYRKLIARYYEALARAKK